MKTILMTLMTLILSVALSSGFATIEVKVKKNDDQEIMTEAINQDKNNVAYANDEVIPALHKVKEEQKQKQKEQKQKQIQEATGDKGANQYLRDVLPKHP